jgi:hypothetical protein
MAPLGERWIASSLALLAMTARKTKTPPQIRGRFRILPVFFSLAGLSRLNPS